MSVVSKKPLLNLSVFGGDWTLLVPALVLSLAGILTMSTFGAGASLAPRQLLWLIVAFGAYLGAAAFDMRFLRRTSVVMALYALAFALLSLLLLVAHPVMGARDLVGDELA